MFKKKIFKKNVAVHCNTKEKDLALRTYAHSKGYKWSSGNSFVSRFNREDCCLLIGNGTMADLDNMKNDNRYKILPFEKALKKGYEWNEELGKVVFPASEKEEVKEEVRYPIYAKSRVDNIIVKFTAIETGEVVLSSNESNLSVGYVGYTSTSFVSHTAEDIWQILDYNEERGLYDTQPVLCLGDNIRAIRSIRFYDAINDCTFFHNGERDGVIYENKKPLTKEQLIAFKDEIEEMYKNLKV